MRKFERSTQLILKCIICSLLILNLLGLAVYENLYGFTSTLPSLDGVSIVVFFILFFIIKYALPPDFEYYIRVQNDIIIFEFDEEDHWPINKSFTFVNKERKHLVLSDGTSRIQIAYNKKVLDFLNEIQN